MRAYWPAKYMRGASVIEFSAVNQYMDELKAADAIVWQKSVRLDLIRGELKGKRNVWDVCDPAWWWNPSACAEIAESVDDVVASSLPLAADFNQWVKNAGNRGKIVKVATIKDRLDLTHFPIQRTHADVYTVRLIWYGVAVNRIALFAALANLERLEANGYDIELTIFDDRPDQPWRVTDSFPIYHVQWDVAQENKIIASHDLAVLPPYPGPWGRVKSNNKTVTAQACGLPVAHGDNYQSLEWAIKDHDLRQKIADENFDSVRQEYDAAQSAQEWQELLA